MIRYNCSNCGVELESPSSLIGKEDMCPSCGHTYKVPSCAGALRTTSVEYVDITFWSIPVVSRRQDIESVFETETTTFDVSGATRHHVFKPRMQLLSFDRLLLIIAGPFTAFFLAVAVVLVANILIFLFGSTHQPTPAPPLQEYRNPAEARTPEALAKRWEAASQNAAKAASQPIGKAYWSLWAIFRMPYVAIISAIGLVIGVCFYIKPPEYELTKKEMVKTMCEDRGLVCAKTHVDIVHDMNIWVEAMTPKEKAQEVLIIRDQHWQKFLKRLQLPGCPGTRLSRNGLSSLRDAGCIPFE